MIQIQEVPSKFTQLPKTSCCFLLPLPLLRACPCFWLCWRGDREAALFPHRMSLLLSLHVGAASPPGVTLEQIPRLLTQQGDRSRQGHCLGQGHCLVSPEEGERMP